MSGFPSAGIKSAPLNSPSVGVKNTGENQNISLLGQWAGGNCYAVKIRGKKAYFGNGGYFQIADVSHPEAALVLGGILMPEPIHDIEINGGVAVVAMKGLGVALLDITNIGHPVELSRFQTRSHPENISVQGNILVISEGNSGFQILDISDHAHPFEIGSLNPEVFVNNSALNGNYLYVAGLSGGLVIYDIEDWRDINEVWRTEQGHVFTDVVIRDGIAYVGDAYIGFVVYDVSDPAVPLEIASTGYGMGNRMVLQGRFLYQIQYDHGFSIYDVSDPTDIVFEGYTQVPRFSGNDISARPDFVAVANGAYGLEFFDVQDPEMPLSVGNVDTGGKLDGVVYGDGYAYTTDSMGKIRRFDVRDPGSPSQVEFCDSLTATDLDWNDGYLYVFRTQELNIFDTRNPADIVLCSAQPYFRQGNAIFGKYQSGHVYVVNSDRELLVVDVRNPGTPMDEGYSGGLLDPTGLAIGDGFAYVSDLNSGLYIVDVHNGNNPYIADRLDLSGQHVGVSYANGVAFLIRGYGASPALDIVDVHNPEAPFLEYRYWFSDYHSSGFLYPGKVTVDGDWAYVAADEDGLKILNVGVPSRPYLAGYYDTGGNAFWVSLGDSLVYVADADYGLGIYRDDVVMRDVSLSLDPDPDFLEIPAEGGVFHYDLALVNSSSEDVSVNIGIECVSPAGELLKLKKRRDVLVEAHSTIRRFGLSQFVPDETPAGDYYYRAYAANSGEAILAHDELHFRKISGLISAKSDEGWHLVGLDDNGPTRDLLAVDDAESRGVEFQAFPNPFNPQVTLSFNLSETDVIMAQVWDVKGRLVKTLLDQAVCAQGRNEIVWYGRDDSGRRVASGAYFVRLSGNRIRETKRVVLVK